MDNVAHTLAGAALARGAGPDRPRGTTVALLLASNLPDIDLILFARPEPSYLLFHRGLSHSILGLAIMPTVLAIGIWWGLGRRTPFRWLATMAWIGVAIHLVYDLVTPWGTMLLYPFSYRRFALDWLFIIDPVLWLAPLIAILVSWRRPALSRRAGRGFVAFLAIYIVAAGLLHAGVRAAVGHAASASGRAPVETFAIPRPLAPFRWTGLAVADPVESGAGIARFTATAVPWRVEFTDHVARGFDGPAVRRALQSRDGQAFLWWARVPVARTEHDSAGGVSVWIRDLRYERPIPGTPEPASPFEVRFHFPEGPDGPLAVSW